jgi:hypothetical protein
MNTHVLATYLTTSNRGAAQALEVVGVVHRLIGALILVTAVLLVATAGPRLRSRLGAVAVALVMLAVVATGCAEPAAAATPAGTSGGSNDTMVLAVTIAAVIAAAALFVAVARIAFWVFTIVARALQLVLVIRHAAMFASVLAVAAGAFAIRV